LNLTTFHRATHEPAEEISKILERRAGGEVKKLRAQMLRLAKSMGYELVASKEPLR